jgi:3-oxoacyl-(acyl-carrier-protein) synthase
VKHWEPTTTAQEAPKPATAAAGFAASPCAVRVAGWGVATPLGVDASSTWDALIAGQFITDHALVPLGRDGDGCRVSQLATVVAREAIASAHWGSSQIEDDSTALVLGTSKGPMTAWLAPPPRGATLSDVQSPAGGYELSFGLAQVAANVAGELRLGSGPRLTLSAACSSGLHALIRAAMLIQSAEARRALVVAAESSVHPLFIGSFQRLKILAREGAGCRPFDRHRTGFLISKPAAAVCLESSEVEGSGAKLDHPTARQLFVERFALAADATHLTGADPDGRALRHCLRRVTANRPVDLIHAHGTGTIVNDPLELAAIESSVAHHAAPPAIYSHKGPLGHSLGAAGLVSVVLDCMSHQAAVVPPNVQTRDPLPTEAAIISRPLLERRISRSIAAAAGFGGAIAAVSLISR